MKGFAECKHI